MARIICLANSWKRKERCIAGIDLATGQWVRPVTDTPDGSVPRLTRLVASGEPALLDLLEIPLAATGPDYGIESENRLILPGRWRRVGRVQPRDVLHYCQHDGDILHNALHTVSVPYLEALPPPARRSLQLVEAVRFSARASGQRNWGSRIWEGTLVTPRGRTLTARITDPVFAERLSLGRPPRGRCLVTVSLSMPWRPPDWEGDTPCWKLIAAVIDLEEEAALHRDFDEDELSTIPF